MSTILKALQRLDEEKRAQAGRSLEEQVIARGGAKRPAPRARSPLLVVVALAAVVLLGAGAWWLRSSRPTSALAAHAPQQPEPGLHPVPASLEGAPLAGAPLEEAPEAEPVPPPVAVVEAPRATPAHHEAIARPAPAPEPAVEPPPPAAAAPPVAPAPAPAPKAAPVPAVAVAEPEPAAAEPEVATIAPRPEVWVERTQWHPTPERRRALVRLAGDQPRELAEGDAIGALVIREIQPSGVVFLFQGEEFRRGLGGSP